MSKRRLEGLQRCFETGLRPFAKLRAQSLLSMSGGGLISSHHALKMHKIAVETLQMRAAIDEYGLPGDMARARQIEHSIGDALRIG